MQLDSVRGLKAQLAGEAAAGDAMVVAPITARVGRAHAVAYAAGATEKIDKLPRTVALGIARVGRNDYRLAVRIQRRSLVGTAEIENIRRRARGEVDVRYVGRITKRAVIPNQRRRRPLRIGISVGHFRITAGTLGAFVKLRSSNEVRMLSNNHVFADENKGRAGDAILQPGDFDNGRDPKDRIGALAEFARMSKTRTNRLDAALATIDNGIDFEAKLLGSGRRVTGVAPDPVDIADKVEKSGRTTGHTRGRVTAFEFDNLVVTYDFGNARFDDQIEIEGAGAESFSDGGDSGSLIYTSGDRLAVGLLFAGSDQGGKNDQGLTYANPIAYVFDRLKVELYD